MLCFTLSTYFDSEILTLLLIEMLTLLFHVETCILTLYFRCGTNVACHFWNGLKIYHAQVQPFVSAFH